MLEKKSQKDLIKERRSNFLENHEEDNFISGFILPMYPSQFRSFMRDYGDEFDGYQAQTVNGEKNICHIFLKSNIIYF